MLLGKQHEVLIEIERRDHRRRVGRIADHHGNRFRRRVDQRPLKRDEIVRRRLGRNGPNDAAGNQEAKGVDRIGGVRRQHHVARRGDRLRHVGEAFLRAERGDDLSLRIELHPKSPRVIAGLSPTQAGNSSRGGIAVGARLADGLDQLVDDVFGRREVGVAHAEIDDVCPGGAGLGLELVDLLKDVRRQAPHSVEFRHRAIFPLSARRHCGADGETVTTAGKRAANLKGRRACGGCLPLRFCLLFGGSRRNRFRGRRKSRQQRVVTLADRFEVAADRLDFLGVLGLAGRLVGRREYRDIRLRLGRARPLDEIGRRLDIGGEAEAFGERVNRRGRITLRRRFLGWRNAGGERRPSNRQSRCRGSPAAEYPRVRAQTYRSAFRRARTVAALGHALAYGLP